MLYHLTVVNYNEPRYLPPSARIALSQIRQYFGGQGWLGRLRFSYVSPNRVAFLASGGPLARVRTRLDYLRANWGGHSHGLSISM